MERFFYWDWFKLLCEIKKSRAKHEEFFMPLILGSLVLIYSIKEAIKQLLSCIKVGLLLGIVGKLKGSIKKESVSNGN